MNLTFFFGLNRLAGSMSPMFPSLIRSRNERPQPRYFLAKLTTNRRFASTSFCRASLLPCWMRSPRTFSSSGVIRSSLEISWRYFLRVSEETLFRRTFSSSISPLLDRTHPRRLGFDERVRRAGPGILLALAQLVAKRLEKLIEVPLHGLHGFLHLQDDLHAGEVDAELPGQAQNPGEARQILVRVEARIPLGPRGLQKSLPLVQTKGLRVHVEAARDDADHVESLVAFHGHCPSSLRAGAYVTTNGP